MSPFLTQRPIGVLGELHIGGDGLARGYLKRDQLTTEKFIKHPFLRESRLYKTGDLVRRKKDGSIEFVGRFDNQIKLRGFRMELGEIESCLQGVDGLKQAVVIPREDQPGDKRLVAYYTIDDGARVEPATLLDFVKNRLPEYMIPSAFVPLEMFPLTPSRNVDRKSLPIPESYATKEESLFEQPEGETETRLARIMKAVLNVPSLGRNDSFFDLGGHSILALRLSNRIEREFGKRLELATIFWAETVKTLAKYLDGVQASHEAWPSLVAIQPEDSRLPFY